MGLAVLLDAVRQGLETPVLVLGDLAATLGENFGQRIGQFFDLLGGNVLPGEIDVFVKGNEVRLPFEWFSHCVLSARSPFEAGKATKQSCKEREHGRPGQKPYLPMADPPFSPRPNECEAGHRGKGR